MRGLTRAGVERSSAADVVQADEHRGDLRRTGDASVERHRADLVDGGEPDLDVLRHVELLDAREDGVADDEQMKMCGSVRRVGEKRAHELRRRTGITGLFRELP